MGIMMIPYMMTTASAEYDGWWDQLDDDVVWRQGVLLPVTLTDHDGNKDSQSVDTLSLSTAYDELLIELVNNNSELKISSIPYLKIGRPAMIGNGGLESYGGFSADYAITDVTLSGIPVSTGKTIDDTICSQNQYDHLCSGNTNDMARQLKGGILTINTHQTDDIVINNGDSLIIQGSHNLLIPGSSTYGNCQHVSHWECSLITADIDTIFRF